MKKRCRRSGKVKFKTHEQAAVRAGEILVQSPAALKFLRAYLCEFCGKWHLTSREI